MKRSVDRLLDDIIQAAAVADEIVRRGRPTSNPTAYHRLDYGRVWNTRCDDIPRLRAAIERYRG